MMLRGMIMVFFCFSFCVFLFLLRIEMKFVLMSMLIVELIVLRS